MKMNRTAGRILAMMLMVALMLTMFAGSALAASYVKATAGRVNVRSGPGTNYTDLYTLVRDETVEYLGVSARDNNGLLWYKVQYYSYGPGWVASSHSKIVGSPSSSGSGSGSSGSYVQASGGNVNVRNIPNLTGKDLGTLKRGETATYLGSTSTDDRGVVWYKVSFRGSTGWVSSRYSKLVGSSSSGSSNSGSSSNIPTSGNYVKATGGNSNVRSQPNLNGSYLGLLRKGSTVAYLGQKSVDERGVAWYRISFEGGTGWVSSRYTTLY